MISQYHEYSEKHLNWPMARIFGRVNETNPKDQRPETGKNKGRSFRIYIYKEQRKGDIS